MRMARVTPARTTPSPKRVAKAVNQPSASLAMRSETASARPVKSSAQVEALTNRDSDAPVCSAQLPPASLSASSASMVPASGTRSRASAKHMSAMPSSLDRPNSCRKESRMGRSPLRWRQPCTRSRACAMMRWRCPGESAMSSKRARSAASSSSATAPLTAARSTLSRAADIAQPSAAALVPAARPNTAPEVRPVPPG